MQIEEDNALQTRLKLYAEKGDDWLEITMPIITESEANGGAKKVFKRNGKTCYKSEHWSEKNSRRQRQKGTIALMLRPHRDCVSMPCHITLTRYAPRKLDKFDNLPMSMKYILDSVCEIITNDFVPGRADSHEGLIVTYDQVVCEDYGVKVRIQTLTASYCKSYLQTLLLKISERFIHLKEIPLMEAFAGAKEFNFTS